MNNKMDITIFEFHSKIPVRQLYFLEYVNKLLEHIEQKLTSSVDTMLLFIRNFKETFLEN